MNTPTFNQFAETPRARLFWALLGVVVLAQVVALYMLCNQQVRKAQMRDDMVRVRHTAMADCLDYLPKSTISSCRSTALNADTQPAPAVMAVGFNYR
jgi:hypothetical protein